MDDDDADDCNESTAVLDDALLLFLDDFDDFDVDEDDVDTEVSLSCPLLEFIILFVLLLCLLSLSLKLFDVAADDDDETLFLPPDTNPLVVDDIDVELRWLLVELLDKFCEPETAPLLMLADDPLLEVLPDFFCFEFCSDFGRFVSASFSGEDGASLECAS